MYDLWFTAEMAAIYNSNLQPGQSPKPVQDVFLNTVTSGKNLEAPNGTTFADASRENRAILNAAGVFPVADPGEPDQTWQTITGRRSHTLDRTLGVSVIGYSTVPITVPEARRRLREKIKEHRDKVLYGGYRWDRNEVESYIVDTDDRAQFRLTSAYNAAADGHVTSMAWRMKDNSVITLSAPELIHLALCVMEHVSNCYKFQGQLEQDLRDLSSTDLEVYKTFDPTGYFPSIPIPDDNDELG